MVIAGTGLETDTLPPDMWSGERTTTAGDELSGGPDLRAPSSADPYSGCATTPSQGRYKF